MAAWGDHSGGRRKPREAGVGDGRVGIILLLVGQPFGQIAVGIYAALAEEGPDSAEFGLEFEVHVGVEDFLVFLGGFGDEADVGIGDEGRARECRVAFATDAVDGSPALGRGAKGEFMFRPVMQGSGVEIRA